MHWESEFRRVISGQRRGAAAAALRGLLAAAEGPYAWIVRRKNARFDAGRAKAATFDAPVISVGNLTVGGTGKTPMVLWIARWLMERGAPVTVISRGYGARRQPLTPGPSPARGEGRTNDEAQELVARLPGARQVQNPDRVAAAREALQENPRQALVLDDAFQHRRIARDLDIVLLDALAPFGFERLLPRGLLREPASGLARAHVVGLSRADAVDASRREEIRQRVAALAPQALWLELAHQPTALVALDGRRESLAAWRGRRVAAFCGIGNPAGFRHTLASCGLEVAALRELPDHFAYPPRAVADLENWLRTHSGIAAAVCTRKDLVKLPLESLAGLPLYALEIDVAITSGQEKLESRLRDLVAHLVRPHPSPLPEGEGARHDE
jgi:tetraacyldisaccharide 4'-kinase